ncbi:MAG TPA: ribose 5-phosphate isomerase A [Parachlamydiales bacterium]|nr:ribose 5-phosphate isomerase A [Parachlamydiales bacterium]HCJ82824.1 ribose 5-phosphate isomerase A [Parachlamydiales bacterium]HCJ84636.1 ribose 5-phosphate isomerase A [Parachlamydiales bacterium]
MMDAIKKRLGRAAAELIKSGMRVGLGSGSTAHFFIKRLGELCAEGLAIQAVASSNESEELAKRAGIPLTDINQLSSLDIAVDGADEIDEQKRMIKGGGGALVREKILASMSTEMVVLVEESKLCSLLGKKNLPVEMIPFGIQATCRQIERLGFHGSFRKNKKGDLFITDNHNYIFDIHFPRLREHPERDHASLIQLPGVVDTGFFFHLAGRVLIGFSDGQIVTRP